MKAIVLALSVFLGVFAHAESGSTSGSCSGTVEGLGYFYAYTYQYIYMYNGEIQNESHTFSFSGELSGVDSGAQILGRNAGHVIYQAGEYQLAVPWKAGEGLWIKMRSKIPDGPNGGGGKHGRQWVKLCNY